MKKDVEVVDLFSEEINKKDKKWAKKIEKARKKEEKKEKKRQKKLEEQEEEGFDEYLKQIKDKQVLEEAKTIEISSPIDQLEIESSELVEPPKKNKEEKEQIFKAIKQTEIKKEESTLENLLNMEDEKKEIIEEIKPEKHPILNTLLVIFSIILIFIGGDYVIYNTITNYTDLPTMINSVIFTLMIFFYLLSVLLKNPKDIKITQILSIICMICFMGYHLFIA